MKRLFSASYDIQGLLFGIIMTSLGVFFLKSAGLVTGQLAGLSVLISLSTDYSFALCFFLINIPFYLLSYRKKGLAFTLRTICSVVGICLCTPLISAHIQFSQLSPLFAGVLAGCCTGMGLIALFRHNASAGGIGILALYLESLFSIKAGWTQLALDFLIFLAACFVLSFQAVIYSFISALIMNLLIAWNFRLQQSKSTSS